MLELTNNPLFTPTRDEEVRPEVVPVSPVHGGAVGPGEGGHHHLRVREAHDGGGALRGARGGRVASRRLSVAKI